MRKDTNAALGTSARPITRLRIIPHEPKNEGTARFVPSFFHISFLFPVVYHNVH
jgi:hypothetical protein